MARTPSPSVRMMGALAVLAGATLASLVIPPEAAVAQQPSRAQQLIEYRQAVYKVLAGNFGPLAAMAQGKAPFDAKEFAVRAERVDFMAGLLPEAYPELSREGAPTKAKREIWENRAEFDRLLNALRERTVRLAKAAPGGNLDELKPLVAETGQACKNCHDRFREK